MNYVEEQIDAVFEEYQEPDSEELEDILSRGWEWEGYEPDFEDDEVGQPGYVVVCEAMAHGHRTEYQMYGGLHRLDGPAKILSYPNGVVIAEWWEFGDLIRRRVGGLDTLVIPR